MVRSTVVKKNSLLFCLIWCSVAPVFGQLDTTSVLTGTWDLVQSSAGYGYLNQDTLLSVSTSFISDHTLKITDKHIMFKSRTILEFLNDSIIEEVKYKRKRKEQFLILKRRRQYALMRIDKLSFDELVLTEQKEHTLPSLFIETSYFYKKRTPSTTQNSYSFTGKWYQQDTCKTCSFWQDTLTLQADTTQGFRYGFNFYLGINYSPEPKKDHNTFNLTSSYFPLPDTSDPYSHLYGKYSVKSIAKNRYWVIDLEKNVMYFYPDFLSDDFYAYRISECIPEEKLILIKQD